MRFEIQFFNSQLLSLYVGWSEHRFREGSGERCIVPPIVMSFRTLRVQVDKEGNACETVYTKAGQDRVIGQIRFYSNLFWFKENVKDNLEKAVGDVRRSIDLDLPQG